MALAGAAIAFMALVMMIQLRSKAGAIIGSSVSTPQEFELKPKWLSKFVVHDDDDDVKIMMMEMAVIAMIVVSMLVMRAIILLMMLCVLQINICSFVCYTFS